jgi:hypothetical protein
MSALFSTKARAPAEGAAEPRSPLTLVATTVQPIWTPNSLMSTRPVAASGRSTLTRATSTVDAVGRAPFVRAVSEMDPRSVEASTVARLLLCGQC